MWCSLYQCYFHGGFGWFFILGPLNSQCIAIWRLWLRWNDSAVRVQWPRWQQVTERCIKTDWGKIIVGSWAGTRVISITWITAAYGATRKWGAASLRKCPGSAYWGTDRDCGQLDPGTSQMTVLSAETHTLTDTHTGHEASHRINTLLHIKDLIKGCSH